MCARRLCNTVWYTTGIMNLTRLIGSFNFKKFSKAGRPDFGVLKVASMVAWSGVRIFGL